MKRNLLLAGAMALAATPALAAGDAGNGLQAMRELNLIVLGNMSGGHDVEGKTFVGGELSGNNTPLGIGNGSQGAAPSARRTLTVGGNDLLAAYGDTTSAREVIAHVRDAVARVLETVGASLAPAGRLVVGTVYDPSDGTGDAAALGLPPWPDAVAVIDELDDALREVARASGAAVAEIGQRFRGHGLLAGDITRPQARPADRDVWLCSVIEPNAWGASGVREAFWVAAGLGEVPER